MGRTWLHSLGAALLLLAGSAFSQPDNDLCVALGAIVPRGDFERYADAGPNVELSGVIRFADNSPIAAVVGIDAAFFEEESEKFFLSGGGYNIEAEKKVSQYAFSLNAGLRFSPLERTSFFRPYLTAAPGLYVFNTQTEVRIEDDPDDEALDSDNDAQVRFGIRAGGGIDLAFSETWSLGLKYIFDAVVDLQQVATVTEGREVIMEKRTARFDSIMLQVTFPISVFESNENDDNDEDD
jgi:hypothetical protein